VWQEEKGTLDPNFLGVGRQIYRVECTMKDRLRRYKTVRNTQSEPPGFEPLTLLGNCRKYTAWPDDGSSIEIKLIFPPGSLGFTSSLTFGV
jgi:hypothetical protein